MKQYNTPSQNSQFHVSFIKRSQLNQIEQKQRNLYIDQLRVGAAEKLRLIQDAIYMSDKELQNLFQNYELFPQSPFSIFSLIRNNVKIYCGQVRSKQMSGYGINILSEGNLYEGEFIQNRKQGFGCEVYKNCNLYIGQFMNNKKHGKGILYWFSNTNKQKGEQIQFYEGEWWGGLPDGKGIYYKANGNQYEGTFKNGLKHGFGTQNFHNGDYYRGNYINGLPQGIGEYTWADQSYYKGDFKQGLRSGYGHWQANKNKNSDYYEGSYNMDKKSGYGIYVWANQWVYKGNFQNDLREGFGELFQGDKCVYSGNWRKGLREIEQPENNIVRLSNLQRKQQEIEEKQLQIPKIQQIINKQQKKKQYFEHQLLERPDSNQQQLSSRKNVSSQKTKKVRNKSLHDGQNRRIIGTLIELPIAKTLASTYCSK